MSIYFNVIPYEYHIDVIKKNLFSSFARNMKTEKSILDFKKNSLSWQSFLPFDEIDPGTLHHPLIPKEARPITLIVLFIFYFFYY